MSAPSYTHARSLALIGLFVAVQAHVSDRPHAQQPVSGASAVQPVNHLPNPYETVRNFGSLPAGRKWGSLSALQVDRDGRQQASDLRSGWQVHRRVEAVQPHQRAAHRSG